MAVGLPLAGFFAVLPSQQHHQEELILNRADPPTTLWSQTFGTTNSEDARDLVECSSGGFAFVGEIQVSGHGTDVWLVRTDNNGNQLWNRTFGGTYSEDGKALTECSDGGFAITGYKYSGGLYPDLWLIRTNSTGHEQWNQVFDVYATDVGNDVIECSGGGFAVIGTTQNTSHTYNFLLLRTDATGNHLWNQSFGYAGSERGYSIVEASSGGFALAGSKYVGNTDMWLVRTDASGNHQWNKTYGGPYGEACNELVECSDGGFALTGYAYNTDTGDDDYWLVRTDAAGVHQWNQSYHGLSEDEAKGLVECSDGGFALIGSGGYVDEEIRRGGCQKGKWAGEEDMWLVRTDASGNHVWNQSFGGTNDDDGRAIVSCSDGGFALAGITMSYGAGNYDAWLVRVGQGNLPPTWVETPTDQVAIAGMPFLYDLEATDPEGSLDSWWLNDTTNFAIDAEGEITNAAVLEEGSYGLQVSVNDSYGNVLTAVFTVVVVPAFPWHLVIFLAAGVTLFVLFFACLRKYGKV